MLFLVCFSGPDYYCDTDACTPGIASPAVDRWDAIKRGAIRYGDLQKTSFNHGSDKPHGLPNKRLFRLTEDAIEYYHVYFGQVCVRVCMSCLFVCLFAFNPHLSVFNPQIGLYPQIVVSDPFLPASKLA